MDSDRLETVPNGVAHLDTVRALHQTVVSLRTALEVSKNELKTLKEKYEQQSRCTDYEDIIEKLTLENHILRRKIIDSHYEDSNTQNIKLEVTYSPRVEDIEGTGSEVVIKTATSDSNTVDIEPEPQDEPESTVQFCTAEKLHDIQEELNVSPEVKIDELNSQVTSFPKDSEQEGHQPSFKTKLELLSKFDVRIKVRTLKEGAIISSTTSESDSTTEEKVPKESDVRFQFGERKEHFENIEGPKGESINVRTVSKENIKMAVPNEAEAKAKVDKFDVQVRITSEESLVMKENVERSRRKETLNLDVDDLSLRSLSEGDNSVFSEGVATPVDPGGEDKLDQETASGNESEEVDDIELIFTTDESKDMSNLQEDLVSIRESEQWTPGSASTTHSTPVLIKFHTLDPDFQPGGETRDNAENENQENTSLQSVIAESSLRMKRVSLPSDKEIKHVAFNGKGSLDLPGRGILKSCDNKSDNMLYRKSPNTSTRRLDSVDSLTCEYNRGLSFDNTKSSSFELGSSMDILHRDESIENFHRTSNFGHRFSVFAETDISKCGISEDDLLGNLNVRRNTCPNPFQYRPVGYRGAWRGPMRAGAGPGTGPAAGPGAGLLAAGGTRGGPRRESGAQTDVSALPPRWSSDGYLAHKIPLPSVGESYVGAAGGGCGACGARGAGPGPGRAPRRPSAPRPPRADDTRRLLLSDIGFTSMVPELSRSADPVWALGKRASPQPAAGPAPPSFGPAAVPGFSPTSKFMSRGSYRSPCLSIDRSNDWLSQTQPVYLPHTKEWRGWRSSLPDVRDDTDELLYETDAYLRRSIDNLRSSSVSTALDLDGSAVVCGQPYIPSEPRQLRLGHTVKLISPQGRVVIGRVRYVGLAGSTAASSSVVVGAEVSREAVGSHNDGTYRGRRYFLAAPSAAALFVPFSKVVMAWAN
ncbi:uncharacterized protein LOC116413090 [Galleria mellonella]|uniref:Uncharacterized protein LOC116413090 n=1 Tax=Galleria mellonella TaxID=7137 RepID=A0ABM3MIB3_GALME|nr:uncharacterized protein LOC116413090 [Galleria mellonella]